MRPLIASIWAIRHPNLWAARNIGLSADTGTGRCHIEKVIEILAMLAWFTVRPV
jgi:hypothetical protein